LVDFYEALPLLRPVRLERAAARYSSSFQYPICVAPSKM
jgi:hypothetical protein